VNQSIFDLRFVPPLAAVCLSLLHRKGKKRATSFAHPISRREQGVNNQQIRPGI